jgi:hypothetical protein
MKKMILGIAIMLVSVGLSSPSAMARELRGGAMSHRPGVEMRGKVHSPRVERPMSRPMIGGTHSAMHYGMRLANRPAGVIVNFGGLTFIYNDGVFFSAIDRGFEVVRPRVGMIVPSLPVGHTAIMHNGVKHFTHNGILYSPVRRNGTVAFRIAGFI